MENVINLHQFYNNIQDKIGFADDYIRHFNVIKVEDVYQLGKKAVSYSRRTYYKISLVRGISKLHFLNKTFEISGATLIFTNPMTPYSWECISEEQTGYICLFTKDFFTGILNLDHYPVFKYIDASIVPLDSNSADYYESLIHKLQAEMDSHYPFRFDMIRTVVSQIIHEVQKKQPLLEKSDTITNANARIAQQFNNLLDRQFSLAISSQQIKMTQPCNYAEEMNLHVNHLNKALKKTTGKTTSKLIHDRIILESMLLLKNSNWSIGEIAWSMGFSESQHFSSFFKKRLGISPKVFQKTNLD